MKTREQLLAECPEPFRGDLDRWLDELEERVSDVSDMLNIVLISELDKLPEARQAADKLTNLLKP